MIHFLLKLSLFREKSFIFPEILWIEWKQVGRNRMIEQACQLLKDIKNHTQGDEQKLPSYTRDYNRHKGPYEPSRSSSRT